MAQMTTTSDDSCWNTEGSICRWVYTSTDGNEFLAQASDWLVDRPLRIALVLAVAWVLVRFTRRWVSRSIQRIVNPDRSAAARRFRRLGLEPPALLGVDLIDPRRETRAAVISSVIAGSLAVLIWSVAIITAAGIAGLQLGPLIAGAGIAGIAVSFGAQDLVKDWIAGLFVLIEDHYGIGDVVDLGEAVGVVEHFSLRATTLRSVNGTVWHVPNGQVARSGNLSQVWSMALIDVDVAYNTDLETAQQLLHATAAEVCAEEEWAEHVLEPPEVLGVERFGADGITLRLRVKTVAGQQWALQRRLRAAIKEAFDRSQVEIPFPQRTVWMRMAAPGDAAAPTAGASLPANGEERP